jgi:hypothetical protein
MTAGPIITGGPRHHGRAPPSQAGPALGCPPSPATAAGLVAARATIPSATPAGSHKIIARSSDDRQAQTAITVS